MNPTRSTIAPLEIKICLSQNNTGEQIMIAKILITVAVLLFTVLPPLVGFGESHVLHPDWTKHARLASAYFGI